MLSNLSGIFTNNSNMEPVTNDTMSSRVGNITSPVMSPDMQFNEESLMTVIVYCILFPFSLIGNLTVSIFNLKINVYFRFLAFFYSPDNDLFIITAVCEW